MFTPWLTVCAYMCSSSILCHKNSKTAFCSSLFPFFFFLLFVSPPSANCSVFSSMLSGLTVQKAQHVKIGIRKSEKDGVEWLLWIRLAMQLIMHNYCTVCVVEQNNSHTFTLKTSLFLIFASTRFVLSIHIIQITWEFTNVSMSWGSHKMCGWNEFKMVACYYHRTSKSFQPSIISTHEAFNSSESNSITLLTPFKFHFVLSAYVSTVFPPIQMSIAKDFPRNRTKLKSNNQNGR